MMDIPASAAPDALIIPGCRFPGGRIEHIAAIDDVAIGDSLRHFGWVELLVLLPLSEKHHEFGVLQGLIKILDIVELWVLAPCILNGCRVMGDNVGAKSLELYGNVQGGGVTDVVAVRFECEAKDGDTMVVHITVEVILNFLHHARPLPGVDSVDLLQEIEGIADTELLCAGSERADVFRQTASAETHACIQELSADTFVDADRIRQFCDVGT